MARTTGINEAFISFADASAALERNNILISGIDSIKAHFSSPTPAGTTLQWVPDFVDAAASGDLGYTYGKFVYTRFDSAGNLEQITGIFHTVWKKREDGSWKYVWD
jgi:ketosteroid isomerase-like protein